MTAEEAYVAYQNGKITREEWSEVLVTDLEDTGE